MPKISVVIPIFNKEKYLKATVDSVLNQTFSDFELILIDDGSTDHSLQIIKQYNDVRIRIYTQPNSGVSATRNKGVKLANTTLIAFLDADDLWYPNHLEEINRLYTDFPEASFFATAYEVKYNKYLVKDFTHPFDKERLLLDKYYQYTNGVFLFFLSNFAIKKEVFEQAGGFNDIDAEDTDFFLRIGSKYKLAYSKTLTMTHIDNAENSLFTKYTTEKKVLLLNNFTNEEKADKALKKYLDINRFSWVIEYKMQNKKDKAQALAQQINLQNLNNKQRFLIKLSSKQLIFFKKIQNFLKKRSIYISAYTN